MFEAVEAGDDGEGKKRFAVSTTVGVAVFGTMIAVAVAVGGGVVREKKDKGPVEVKFKSVAKKEVKIDLPPPPPPPKPKKPKRKRGKKKAAPPKAPVKITNETLAEADAKDFNRTDDDLSSVTETGGDGGEDDTTTKVIPKPITPPPTPPPVEQVAKVVPKPVFLKDDYVAPACSTATKVAVFYPKEAAQKGIEGKVVIKVKVTESGTLTDFKVVSGPRELVAAAMASIRTFTCSPAQLDGKPTVAYRQFEIPFELKK